MIIGVFKPLSDRELRPSWRKHCGSTMLPLGCSCFHLQLENIIHMCNDDCTVALKYAQLLTFELSCSPENVTGSPENVTCSPENCTCSPGDVTCSPENSKNILVGNAQAHIKGLLGGLYFYLST